MKTKSSQIGGRRLFHGAKPLALVAILLISQSLAASNAAAQSADPRDHHRERSEPRREDYRREDYRREDYRRDGDRRGDDRRAPSPRDSYADPAASRAPPPRYDNPRYGAPRDEPSRTDSLGAGWRQQQYEAREGVREGRIAPLGRVIDEIRRRSPGRQLDAGLEPGANGRTVYRVRWAAADGRRVDYIVDAETGRILGVDGR